MNRISVVYSESKPHMPAHLAELKTWLAKFGWETHTMRARTGSPSAVCAFSSAASVTLGFSTKPISPAFHTALFCSISCFSSIPRGDTT